jgi:hypothetical protein
VVGIILGGISGHKAHGGNVFIGVYLINKTPAIADEGLVWGRGNRVLSYPPYACMRAANPKTFRQTVKA